ncbi:MAG TPA: hypothetical protein VGE74_10195, partial [Gemmata sp.]
MTRTAHHPLLRASALLVHTFARAEWQPIEGGKWRSSGGRVLSNDAYQRHQQRLKTREGKPAAAPKRGAPKSTAPAPAQPGSAPRKPATGKNVYGQEIELGPFMRPGEAAPRTKAPAPKPAGRLELGQSLPGYTPPPAAPVRAPALPGGARLPDPNPTESAYLNRQHGR